MALAVIACALAAPAQAHAVEAPWTGAGTEESPYQIATAADLRAIAPTLAASRTFRGKCYELTADIDLAGSAFTPIGTTNIPFSGTFDGKGHEITRLNVNKGEDLYAGLFGVVGEFDSYTGAGLYPAVIKNFTVSGTVRGTSFAGGVVGLAQRQTSIEGVTSKVTVIAGGMYAGGIVGRAAIEGTGVSLTVRNCTNEGSVSADSREAGGIVGSLDCYYAYTGASIVESCGNKGTVRSTGTADSSVAGIVGAARVSSGNAGLTIRNCYSTGSVSATPLEGYSASPYGIIGTHPSDTVQKLAVSNCYSTIEPYDQAAKAGLTVKSVQRKTAEQMTEAFIAQVLAGQVPGEGGGEPDPDPGTDPGTDPEPEPAAVIISDAQGWLDFAKAVNEGDTFLGKTVKLGADIDLTGRVVEPVGSASDVATWTGAYFMGDFDGQGHSVTLNISGGAYWSGLFGFVSGSASSSGGSSTVKNLVVKGSVSGGLMYVGGVAGGAGRVVFENVRSEVAVSSASALPQACVGGLVGWASSEARLRNCAMRGSVSAPDAGCVGGLVGGIDYRSSVAPSYSDCYANGSVTGDEAVGGLVGACGSKTLSWASYALSLERCYVAGAPVGKFETGMLVGRLDAQESGGTSSLSAQTSCYNADAAGSMRVAGSGAGSARATALSASDLKLAFARLGGAYKANPSAVNDGYPLLSWESGGEVDTAAAQALADGVAAQIRAIGEVTLEREQAVVAARAAYDSLDAASKALVSSADVKTLEDAEASLVALKAAEDERQRQAEAERQRQEAEAEAERQRQEAEAEAERQRQEAEAEAERQRQAEAAAAAERQRQEAAAAAAAEAERQRQAEGQKAADEGQAGQAGPGGGSTASPQPAPSSAPAKQAQKITASKAKKTLKASALAKKARTISAAKLGKVSGAKTRVTYTGSAKLGKKSAKAYITVSKKGVIKVKRWTPKGTYQVKVTAKAAASERYRAASKKFTITVKVK